MSKIVKVSARQILDSRGNPTIATTITLDSDITVTAACPSGASTGTHEALELRDKDQNVYAGKSVLKAVENVNTTIRDALSGKELSNIQELDGILVTLDGTENKSRLGANALLSVSMALTKALALQEKMPLYQYISTLSGISLNPILPKPLCNLLNGGMHAGGNLNIQEFIVIPLSSDSFAANIEKAVTVYNALRHILVNKGFQPLVGDEGGFAPVLKTNEEALNLLSEAITAVKMTLGKDMMLGIDAAASSFFSNGMYSLKDFPNSLNASELGDFYKDLVNKYSLLYLEDIFAEDDLVGWSTFTPQAPAETIVVGDDLTCTNPKRLEMALEKQMIRGIIIKPNQIGTVSETLAVVQMAQKANLKIIVSHRSGETNDDFIADLAVGVGADFAKFGAPVRGERVAKYNRLLQIEQELNHGIV